MHSIEAWNKHNTSYCKQKKVGNEIFVCNQMAWGAWNRFGEKYMQCPETRLRYADILKEFWSERQLYWPIGLIGSVFQSVLNNRVGSKEFHDHIVQNCNLAQVPMESLKANSFWADAETQDVR